MAPVETDLIDQGLRRLMATQAKASSARGKAGKIFASGGNDVSRLKATGWHVA